MKQNYFHWGKTCHVGLTVDGKLLMDLSLVSATHVFHVIFALNE